MGLKKITALMVKPQEHPEVVELENSLDALQKAVSIGAEYQGLIEFISLENGVSILCNEEAKLVSLDGNRRVGKDIIAGVFYVVGDDGKGNLQSLSKTAIEIYREKFWAVEKFSPQDVERAIFMRFISI